jgi:hypothetical protein
MSDLHVDFWAASAAISPVLGLTHSLITSALYGATSSLYRRLGEDLSQDAEAIKLRDYLGRLSNVSMGSVAGSIAAMTWSLISLGFAFDYSWARIITSFLLAASMCTSLALGVLTTSSAARLAEFKVELGRPG